MKVSLILLATLAVYVVDSKVCKKEAFRRAKDVAGCQTIIGKLVVTRKLLNGALTGLQSVMGEIEIKGGRNIYFPDLVAAWDIKLSGNGRTVQSINFPKLRIANQILLTDYEEETTKKLKRISFPSLVTAYEIKLNELRKVRSVSFPELVSLSYAAYIKNTRRLEVVYMPKLKSSEYLNIDDNKDLVSARFDAFELARADVTVRNNRKLKSFSVANVQYVGTLKVQGNLELTSVVMPATRMSTSAYIEDNAKLTAVSFSQLLNLDGSIAVRRNPRLASLILPTAEFVRAVHVEDNKKLILVWVPKMNGMNEVHFIGNSMLQKATFPLLLYAKEIKSENNGVDDASFHQSSFPRIPMMCTLGGGEGNCWPDNLQEEGWRRLV